MLPKKVIRTFTLISSFLAVGAGFQNCAEHGAFVVADEMSFSSMASSDDAGNYSDQLSHSGVNHVPPMAKEADLDYSPVVMDRISIYNFFEDVFGPGAKNLPAVKSIARDPNIFGGGCSFYRQSTTAPADLTTYCANNNGSLSVKPLMGVTVLRQGRVNQACHELAQNSTTMTYILTRIDSKNKIPPATVQNLTNLFTLFYRAKPAPHNSLYEAIAANMGAETLDGWRRAVYGICVSGYWQEL